MSESQAARQDALDCDGDSRARLFSRWLTFSRSALKVLARALLLSHLPIQYYFFALEIKQTQARQAVRIAQPFEQEIIERLLEDGAFHPAAIWLQLFFRCSASHRQLA